MTADPPRIAVRRPCLRLGANNDETPLTTLPRLDHSDITVWRRMASIGGGKLLSLVTFFAAAKKVTAAPHRGRANNPTRIQVQQQRINITRCNPHQPPPKRQRSPPSLAPPLGILLRQLQQLGNLFVARLRKVDIKLPDPEEITRPHDANKLIHDAFDLRVRIRRRNRQRRHDPRRLPLPQCHRRGSRKS